MFLSERKPFRIDSNDYVSDNQLFKVTSIFAHFHEYKLQTLLEKSVSSLQFSNWSMLEPEWSTKEIDFDYYVINH